MTTPFVHGSVTLLLTSETISATGFRGRGAAKAAISVAQKKAIAVGVPKQETFTPATTHFALRV